MVMARVAAALVFVECLQAFAPPPLLRAGPRVSSSQRRAALEIAEESEDFVRVSQMFVEAFWTDKAEGLELKEEQRRRLRREQEVEFRRRYGSRQDPTRRRSAFFVATDGDGWPVGCAGVELDGAAGDSAIVPVMSNLAVGRDGRRRGVGAKLVKACEKSAMGWGCETMTLVVEAKNTPAKKLYQKLGYQEVGEPDSDAKTLTPMKDGRVVSTGTTTLTMEKELRGAGGLALPVAAVVGVGAVVAALQLDLLPV